MGIHYYVVYDPEKLIQDKELQVYENYVGEFLPRPDDNLPRIGLQLTLWAGRFEERYDIWLRWCDRDGKMLRTGSEQAESERQRAENEHLRAEAAVKQAELLASKLRELGIDPDKLS